MGVLTDGTALDRWSMPGRRMDMLINYVWMVLLSINRVGKDDILIHRVQRIT